MCSISEMEVLYLHYNYVRVGGNKMSKVSICPKCVKELGYVAERQRKITALGKVMYENNPSNYTGYWICDEYGPDGNKCMKCGGELEETNLENRELMYIQRISKNPDYILAMNDLKGKDIIEFESKMENIRQQLSDRDNQAKVQRETQQKTEEKEANQVKCPKCGSTQIGVTNRGYSLLSGFIGSGSARNVCQNCGYKWKPGK